MNGFDEEKFLEHQRWEERAAQEAIGEAAARAEYETYKAYVEPLEIENAQLKKELERYREIFSVKGKGLTPEQEEFWSNTEQLECSGIEAEILFVACCEWRTQSNHYPMLVIMRDKFTFGSNFYTVDGRYDLSRESNMDIIRREVPNE